MALYPVKFHFPFQILPQESVEFTVEDEIETIKFVLNPLLRFYNPTATSTMHLTIQHVLDLGFGDDPLNSGTFTTPVVSEDIPPNSFADYSFTPQIDLDEQIATRHVVTIDNLSATETEIVRAILFGSSEVQIQLPATQTVIKNQTS